MNKLICKPCLAFEALASIVFSGYHRSDVPEISDWINKTYSGIEIYPSNYYFDLLAAHHSLDEICTFDVEKLAEIYPRYIAESTISEYQKEQFIKGIAALKASDFISLWHRKILPILEDECRRYMLYFDSKAINGILSDISAVHGAKGMGDICIFMTYFTANVSFRIAHGSYITHCGINDVNTSLKLFVHELCHGFSSPESRRTYRALCDSDPYLRRVNWFLNEFMSHPGDEEEFVQAIEMAIAVKNGIITYGEALDQFRGRYMCSVPVAVIMFDELHKATQLPENMNEWILNQFSGGALRAGDIREKVNGIIPGYSHRFEQHFIEQRGKYPDRFEN